MNDNTYYKIWYEYKSKSNGRAIKVYDGTCYSTYKEADAALSDKLSDLEEHGYEHLGGDIEETSSDMRYQKLKAKYNS